MKKTSVSPQVGPEERIFEIQTLLLRALSSYKTLLTATQDGELRLQSIWYMIYWYHRLRNNPEEQTRIKQNLIEYLGSSAKDARLVTESLLADVSLRAPAIEYVETLLVPTRTVDLVVTRAGKEKDKNSDVLCQKRTYYPFGSALPGGLIRDDDEHNELNLPAHIFAALRVAGSKVLGLKEGTVRYSQQSDPRGRKYFLVRGKANTPAVRLFTEDEGGYRYRENIKSVLRPADPRHLVDTVGFSCELVGELTTPLVWRKKSAIMSSQARGGGFAFGHHREIVAYVIAQTSVSKERELKEREFIRSIIQRPAKTYQKLQKRFSKMNNSPEASFPELFPVVDRLLNEIFHPEINQLCHSIPLIAGIRDKAVISLRHVSLKNRTLCPYLPTLRAIAETVAFFDLVARQRKDFYQNMPKESIVEHNPRKTPYASYHMYRYKYRLDQVMGMVPHEIIIPTFEELSVTDLMRIRCVPIRFIGLSRDFLYVDEFEQSPEEFFMHDMNHTWRMIMEDRAEEKNSHRSKEDLIKESSAFVDEYLGKLQIRTNDSEEKRELKKLKKIILFEVVHEDARPFLKNVICKYVQLKEGGSVAFEVPRIDPKTGYMDVVDTMDTGISTLSYVRNKLQHGFYDHIDVQLPQIVDPKYRTAEWITKAAAEMLKELKAKPQPGVPLDPDGQISFEWLLRRTCAVGPDNIHDADKVDPALKKYGDGAQKLNPKRYQAEE